MIKIRLFNISDDDIHEMPPNVRILSYNGTFLQDFSNSPEAQAILANVHYLSVSVPKKQDLSCPTGLQNLRGVNVFLDREVIFQYKMKRTVPLYMYDITCGILAQTSNLTTLRIFFPNPRVMTEFLNTFITCKISVLTLLYLAGMNMQRIQDSSL